jgi:hypothetical protein
VAYLAGRGELRDPEIQHFDRGGAVRASNAEEVRRLQVPVDDPERVGIGDGLARLQHEIDRQPRRQGPVRLEQRREVRALEVLHDDVRSPVVERADVEHARHVLAMDAHGRSRLAQEARDGVGVAQSLGQQKLEGYLGIELQVLRGEDHAHAPPPEHPLHAVLARDDVARSDCGAHAVGPSYAIQASEALRFGQTANAPGKSHVTT